MRSKKYVVYTVVMLLIIVSLGVSYSYFVSTNSINKKEINISSKKIAIIFTDKTELSESEIVPGWSTSKSFSVENKSNDIFNYNIVIKNLINTFETEGFLQYKITSDTGYNMTDYIDVPKSTERKDVTLAYDIDIEVGVKHEYTIEFIYINSEVDQSVDMGKELGGTLAIVEGSVEPNKFYSVTLNLANGVVIGENPKETIKNGNVSFDYTLNEGYNLGSLSCDNGASIEESEGKIVVSNIKANQVCTANTSKKTYTVSVGTNNSVMGTVTPGSQVIEHGNSATVTINAKSGYGYSSNNCGGSINGNTMTIPNITSNRSCTVTFVALQTLKDKLLTDNPAILTRTDFSKAFTATNTGTLYKATGDITEGGKDVYYFAGNAQNNWVKFGGFYWRIIRINEDNSVRLLYHGTDHTSTQSYINGGEVFNNLDDDAMYVGYMYGSTGSLSNNRNNTTNSSIKAIVDNWYKNNLYNNYNNYLSETAIYCNDRATSSYSTGNLVYATYTRLIDNDRPSYKCGNNEKGLLYSNADNKDKFTISSKTGNGKLTYPVALMTMDEIVFAGGEVYLNTGTAADAQMPDGTTHYLNNQNGNNIATHINKKSNNKLADASTGTYFTLNSLNGNSTGGNSWWTMSPFAMHKNTSVIGTHPASVFRVQGITTVYIASHHSVKNTFAVRPVLSLKSCVTYESGNGSSKSPYTVELNGTCANAGN